MRQGLTRQPALLSLALELGTEPGFRQLLTVLARLARKPDSAEVAEEAFLLFRPYFLRHPAAFGDLMRWITTTYEEATGALGKDPNREFLAEIEAALDSVTVS